MPEFYWDKLAKYRKESPQTAYATTSLSVPGRSAYTGVGNPQNPAGIDFTSNPPVVVHRDEKVIAMPDGSKFVQPSLRNPATANMMFAANPGAEQQLDYMVRTGRARGMAAGGSYGYVPPMLQPKPAPSPAVSGYVPPILQPSAPVVSVKLPPTIAPIATAAPAGQTDPWGNLVTQAPSNDLNPATGMPWGFTPANLESQNMTSNVSASKPNTQYSQNVMAYAARTGMDPAAVQRGMSAGVISLGTQGTLPTNETGAGALPSALTPPTADQVAAAARTPLEPPATPAVVPTQRTTTGGTTPTYDYAAREALQTIEAQMRGEDPYTQNLYSRFIDAYRAGQGTQAQALAQQIASSPGATAGSKNAAQAALALAGAVGEAQLTSQLAAQAQERMGTAAAQAFSMAQEAQANELDRIQKQDQMAWDKFSRAAEAGDDATLAAAYEEYFGTPITDTAMISGLRDYIRGKRSQELVSGQLAIDAQKFGLTEQVFQTVVNAINSGLTDAQSINQRFGTNFTQAEVDGMATTYRQGVTAGALNITQMRNRIGDDQFNRVIDYANKGVTYDSLPDDLKGMVDAAGYGKIQENYSLDLTDRRWQTIASQIQSGVDPETLRTQVAGLLGMAANSDGVSATLDRLGNKFFDVDMEVANIGLQTAREGLSQLQNSQLGQSIEAWKSADIRFWDAYSEPTNKAIWLDAYKAETGNTTATEVPRAWAEGKWATMALDEVTASINQIKAGDWYKGLDSNERADADKLLDASAWLMVSGGATVVKNADGEPIAVISLEGDVIYGEDKLTADNDPRYEKYTASAAAAGKTPLDYATWLDNDTPATYEIEKSLVTELDSLRTAIPDVDASIVNGIHKLLGTEVGSGLTSEQYSKYKPIVGAMSTGDFADINSPINRTVINDLVADGKIAKFDAITKATDPFIQVESGEITDAGGQHGRNSYNSTVMTQDGKFTADFKSKANIGSVITIDGVNYLITGITSRHKTAQIGSTGTRGDYDADCDALSLINLSTGAVKTEDFGFKVRAS